jgi:hypothetical protein
VKHSSGVDEGKSLEKSSAETVLPAVNGEVFAISSINRLHEVIKATV